MPGNIPMFPPVPGQNGAPGAMPVGSRSYLPPGVQGAGELPDLMRGASEEELHSLMMKASPDISQAAAAELNARMQARGVTAQQIPGVVPKGAEFAQGMPKTGQVPVAPGISPEQAEPFGIPQNPPSNNGGFVPPPVGPFAPPSAPPSGAAPFVPPDAKVPFGTPQGERPSLAFDPRFMDPSVPSPELANNPVAQEAADYATERGGQMERSTAASIAAAQAELRRLENKKVTGAGSPSMTKADRNSAAVKPGAFKNDDGSVQLTDDKGGSTTAFEPSDDFEAVIRKAPKAVEKTLQNTAPKKQGDVLEGLVSQVIKKMNEPVNEELTNKEKGEWLLRTGLAVMAAASKPGATALGALGEGGTVGLNWKQQLIDKRKATKATNLDKLLKVTDLVMSMDLRRTQMKMDQYNKEVDRDLKASIASMTNQVALMNAAARQDSNRINQEKLVSSTIDTFDERMNESLQQFPQYAKDPDSPPMWSELTPDQQQMERDKFIMRRFPNSTAAYMAEWKHLSVLEMQLAGDKSPEGRKQYQRVVTRLQQIRQSMGVAGGQ